MRKSKLGLAGLFWASSLLVTPALADVGDIISCAESDVGLGCEGAGGDRNQSGACQESTCTRQTASGEMTYDCVRCVKDAKPTRTLEGEDEDGCSTAATPAGSLLSVLAPLAVLAFAAARRHRARP